MPPAGLQIFKSMLKVHPDGVALTIARDASADSFETSLSPG